MLNDILRRFLAAISGRTRPRRRPSRRWSTRPQLEMLEDRLTPSTLTVMNNADHGGGSLRDTIAAAQTGDTINFASSVHAITLTTGELDIAKNLNIVGTGANHLAISGNDASRVFHIESGKTVTLSNMTIAHGQVSGTLPSSVVGVYSGTGTGAGGGGGILNEAGAHLTLSNDNVTSNKAIHGPSSDSFTVLGGGLLNLGTATVLGCTFSNNQAAGGNAYDNLGGSVGGAIDNFGGPAGGATLTATNSMFSNNSAVAAGGSFFFGIGGAVENNAGLNSYDPSQAMPSTATLTNCNVVNNLATGGPNAIANGGGLVSEGIGVVLSLSGCTINGNRAMGGGGGDGITTGDSEAVGGGIQTAFGTLNVTGCTITNNQAIGGNNVLLSDSDPFAGGAFGGGIQNNFASVLNISNSVIAGNIAQGGAMTTNPGPGGDGIGGGISNSPGAAMVMSNCIVSANSAVGGHGGAGANTSLSGAQGGFGFGGGVDTSRGSSASISGSWITGNSAIGSAGGAGNNGGNGYGGGLGVGFGTLMGSSPDGSQLTVSNTIIAGNLALGGTGGTGANGGNGYGGGLAITASCTATVTSSVVAFNLADGGEKGAGGQVGQGYGGGVYYEDSNGFVDTSTFIFFNDASTSGDNIFLE
jgi:autotransporter family porin